MFMARLKPVTDNIFRDNILKDLEAHQVVSSKEKVVEPAQELGKEKRAKRHPKWLNDFI